MLAYGTNIKVGKKLPFDGAFSSFGRLFPLSFYTGLFVMFPTPRLGQNTIHLYPFAKPFQSAFKWFVFSDDNLRHKPSLPSNNIVVPRLLICKVIIAFPQG